ncbi:MAG: PaaI family thioesterase [Syntrophobacteraceae bacterium]
MRFHTDGKALFSWLTLSSHLSGWQNLVHGGVITTMLDEVMGWSAIYLLKRLVLTKSITVDFLKPVYIENEIRVEGRVSAVKNEREAVMEGLLFDTEGQLCSRARGLFALFPPAMAKKMGMSDDVVLRDLVRLIST